MWYPHTCAMICLFVPIFSFLCFYQHLEESQSLLGNINHLSLHRYTHMYSYIKTYIYMYICVNRKNIHIHISLFLLPSTSTRSGTCGLAGLIRKYLTWHSHSCIVTCFYLNCLLSHYLRWFAGLLTEQVAKHWNELKLQNCATISL